MAIVQQQMMEQQAETMRDIQEDIRRRDETAREDLRRRDDMLQEMLLQHNVLKAELDKTRIDKEVELEAMRAQLVNVQVG
jgi:hypothetical protein